MIDIFVFLTDSYEYQNQCWGAGPFKRDPEPLRKIVRSWSRYTYLEGAGARAEAGEPP